MDEKARHDFFVEYESRLPVNPFQSRFALFLENSAWRPSDGAEPGVFEKRQPGSRCMWSARWNTGEFGIVTPAALLGTAFMNLRQMMWELSDAVFLDSTQGGLCGQAFVNFYHQPAGMSWAQWVKQAHQALNQARAVYPEYLAEWDLPDNVQNYRAIRPGWSDPYRMRAAIRNKRIQQEGA